MRRYNIIYEILRLYEVSDKVIIRQRIIDRKSFSLHLKRFGANILERRQS